MFISDEQLFDYLCGELPEEQRAIIDRQIASNAGLAERLEVLRRTLEELKGAHSVFEPPGDLVESTMARIEEEAKRSESQIRSASRAEPVVSALSPTGSGRTKSFFYDSLALTVCLVVLCSLLLPAMVRARFESRKVQCADNLRQTGTGLIDFATNDPHGRFPHVALEGPFSFAGVYAIHLKSFGVPITPGQVRCVSLFGMPGGENGLVDFKSIPTKQQFLRLDWDNSRLHRAIGGDYAYNLGHIAEEAAVAPRYMGRAGYAILADSPVFLPATEKFIAHDGQGINVLYEDGRVFFVDAEAIMHRVPVADHPFRNHQGIHAIGVNSDDAVLGPSHYPPLGP